VKDPAAALEFYAAGLGMRLVSRMDISRSE
jgi:catechol 2,3-dioxygenase-like lactoylglutathione lyase family enzyme